MAKKRISYGPDTALILGEKQVAESEAMKDTLGGRAFVQGLTGSVLSGIQEQEKRNAKMDAHLDNLGGIQNINLLDEDYNKQAVTNFVRSKRDEYAKLAASYEKTKDRATLDKMDAIKFSFSNLNTQLQALVGEKKAYLSAYDKGQLVTLGNGDEKYTDMYTNNSQFSIDANGDIGFGSGDMYSKFKDEAGKWNVKNNIGETYTLQQNLNARKLGESNKSFYRNDTKNLYASTFKQTGPEGIMVMAKTDLTGDNEYVLPNGQKASSLSFESMWSQGILADKFYEQIPKGTDPSWMYDKKNTSILNDIMSEYYTDVTEFSYNEGKKNYTSRANQNTNTKAANFIIGGQTFNAQDFNANFTPFVKKLPEMKDGEVEKSPTGLVVAKQDGKYYRVTGMKEGKPMLDQDQGAMDLEQLGTFDGWGKFFTFNDPLNPNN